MKSTIWKRLALLTACVMAACTLSAPVAQGEAEVRPQDDLYAAVNAEWLANTKIPADKMSVGGFEDLMDDVEAQLMVDFDDMTPEEAKSFGMLPEFIKLYAMTSDYTTRNAQGADPLQPYLASIDALQNLEDLNAALPELVLVGMSVPRLAAPFSLAVQPDMKDAQHHALYMGMPYLILPDVSYYDLPESASMLESFEQMLHQLLVMSGCSQAKATEIAAQTLAFDQLLKPYANTAKENNDVAGLYNPMTLEEIAQGSQSLDLIALISALTPEPPDYVIVTEPRFVNNLDAIINEETFPLLKGWLYGQLVNSASQALSEEMMATGQSFSMALLGKEEMEDPQKLAYRLASGPYGEVIGDYYGRTYFGEEAKRDVVGMVDHVLAVYTRRLQDNDWLSEETIQAALGKLETMKVRIGYPEKIDPIVEQLLVTEDSMLDNYMKLNRVLVEGLLRRCGQPVDPDPWITTASTVNAFYHFMSNSINFPAAILQEPFYSLSYSQSRNYGSIGAIIAHEITRAFDTNGAKFDQYGNLKDWWTEADYAAFQARTKAMVALFDGLPFGEGKVDGALTVTENISDAGGLSCALEIVQAMPDADVEAFFEGWATIWRGKGTPAYEQLLLAIDPHAPNKLRTNVQAQNLDAFYEAFDVRESDAMYLPRAERVAVW